ncbi:hypothetical protein Veis_0027 [Verminephrobacter eiseniae EF01-2]|uniref:Uncharacterized protein n=1 Tax=Verminephrobacter eiseniae (strain EF01-2) TaxID=391735 RepID=A1WDW3_VEREI|nr:hypothetical protein Veis_0027 [Verminephrobacter eiseniae EF01-2]
MACTSLVSVPMEMRSTPVSASSRRPARVTPPEISRIARPALRRTASRSMGSGMLSSSTILAPASRAWPNCSSVSTSICMNRACAARSSWPTARSTAVTPPAAAMWFSLISTASYRPMRWLLPPPTRTAYFCARRRPGKVLRVSTIRAPVPATASTWMRVRVATALSSCKKFSTVRSALSSARAWPSSVSTTCPGAQRWPSATCQSSSTPGSSARNVASAQGAPQITAASRARMRARARRAGSIRPAVRSPVPRSSASARAASARAMSATLRSWESGVEAGVEVMAASIAASRAGLA